MPGFVSSISNNNEAVFANNADFSGSSDPTELNGLRTNGQLWIGSTALNPGNTHINVGTLTSPLGTVSIGYSSPNITLDITGGAVAIEKVALQTGTTPIVPSGGIITFNGATVAAGTNPVRTDGTGANTMALEVQISQAIAATDATKIGLSNFNSAQFTVDANGFVSLVSGGLDLHTARFIVSAGGASDGANYTTITTAIAAAVAAGGNQTVFIQPGTYTENLTLPVNVNLTAYNCDSQTTASTPTVNIIGQHTATFSGQASYSGLAFTNTGSNNIFTVSGTNPTRLFFSNCTFIINANAIAFRYTSNGSPYLSLINCTGIVTFTGANFFSMTTGSTTDIYNSRFLIAGAATSANSTITDSTFNVYNSVVNIELAILTSAGSSTFTMSNSKMVNNNITCLSFTNTSGSSTLTNCSFESGTASALNIGGVGAPVYVSHCAVSSSNANAITGGAEIRYAFISFYGSSSTVNTATQTPLATLI